MRKSASNPRRIKCRWCDYTVLPIRTTKAGKIVSGFSILHTHQWLKHPEELDVLQQALDEMPFEDMEE